MESREAAPEHTEMEEQAGKRASHPAWIDSRAVTGEIGDSKATMYGPAVLFTAIYAITLLCTGIQEVEKW